MILYLYRGFLSGLGDDLYCTMKITYTEPTFPATAQFLQALVISSTANLSKTMAQIPGTPIFGYVNPNNLNPRSFCIFVVVF